MAGAGQKGDSQRFATFVAILALLLQLAIPPGFMAAATDRGPAIVICTGHGPLLDPGAGHGLPGKSPTSKASGVCPFAGHGGPSLAPATPHVERAAFDVDRQPVNIPSDRWPGRRLAAPPPPSQAPPSALI